MTRAAAGKRGVVVIASGAANEERAQFLEESLERLNCRVERLVIREAAKEGFASREFKTRLPEISPFEETLSLDADIIALRPFDEIWTKLELQDVWMAPDLHFSVGRALADLTSPTSAEEREETRVACPADNRFCNSGVILFRKTRCVRELFERWFLEWQKYQQVDQFALARAIHHCNYQPALLDREYNWHFSTYERCPPNTAFLHLWRVRGESYAETAENLLREYAHAEVNVI